ncbi:IS3 family transposase [Pseudarthrobacter sp. J1738]|uniref:IS3 family transposase n=1 Tax=Pseudarthrobacter sp. J1738 TaxID=3420446 RepID=UPI003D26E2B8
MNVAYTPEQRRHALRTYSRIRSVSKTVRLLGYPGRWTLHSWIKAGKSGARKPRKQAKVLRSYAVEFKLSAVRMLSEGRPVKDIADTLGMVTGAVVYSWAQTYRERGEWGLMSKKERRTQREFPTQASLEASLPDDAGQLKALAAKLMVEKAVMQHELDLIKKDVSVTPGRLSNLIKAEIADALRNKLPLRMILNVLKLSASSFYYQRHVAARPDKHAALREAIHAHATESHYTYGYRRIWWALRHDGVKVSEKVVRTIIREDKIPVRYARRKRRYSSYQGETSAAPPNLVKRNFHAPLPSQLWLTDITEFSSGSGKVYLSAIIDCFDGLVVGYKTGRHPTLEIADESLQQAFAEHYQSHDGNLIIHSDRGTHYRSSSWITATRDAKARRSMSKKGCSPDNSACEGFFGRMKNEMYYHRTWNRADELERAINDYIDFYNNQRIKTSLGGISINKHRKRLAASEPRTV